MPVQLEKQVVSKPQFAFKRPTRTATVQQKIVDTRKRRQDEYLVKAEATRRANRDQSRRSNDEMMRFMWISEQRQWEADQAHIAAAATCEDANMDIGDDMHEANDLEDLNNLIRGEEEDMQTLVAMHEQELANSNDVDGALPQQLGRSQPDNDQELDTSYLWSDGDLEHIDFDGESISGQSMHLGRVDASNGMDESIG
ncbi:MAG: hypothetical protein M1814_001709 [Vezdaea aestivalis]|nr:MAG: hypothetical protein M1814_001709 [Vezdaea aestivalis]